MKIKFEAHNPEWKDSYANIKKELSEILGFINPKIEHIGSTSVAGLSAKPIIDILIGIPNENDLDKTIAPLVTQGYIYYEIYNEVMPYRRFFVKHQSSPQSLNTPRIIRSEADIPKSTHEHNRRVAHIHVLRFDSEHWMRHIAFRDYLKNQYNVKVAYQNLKENLSLQEWVDGNDYNKEKDKFLKKEEQNAIDWFKKKNAIGNE